MKTNFMENNHVVHCAPAATIPSAEDCGNTSMVCDVMSLKNADGAVFMHVTMTNAGGASTLYICAADDTTPTTTVAVSFRYTTIQAPDTIAATGESKGLLTSTGADYIYVLEVDAAKIAEQGYEFVQCVGVEVTATAVDGAIVGWLTGLRYKEDDIGTQVT